MPLSTEFGACNITFGACYITFGACYITFCACFVNVTSHQMYNTNPQAQNGSIFDPKSGTDSVDPNRERFLLRPVIC